MPRCLHHVSLTCRNLRQSQQFYTQFGYSVDRDYTDAEITIVMMTSASGPALELFCFADSGTDCDPINQHREMPDIHKPGITHLAFTVEDITTTHQQLSGSAPCTPIRPARLGGFCYFFTHDPDGNQIEIIMENKQC